MSLHRRDRRRVLHGIEGHPGADIRSFGRVATSQSFCLRSLLSHPFLGTGSHVFQQADGSWIGAPGRPMAQAWLCRPDTDLLQCHAARRGFRLVLVELGTPTDNLRDERRVRKTRLGHPAFRHASPSASLDAGRVAIPDIVYEGVINSYDTHPQNLLLPFFELLFEECGLVRPDGYRRPT
jgi:hypothetical protein